MHSLPRMRWKWEAAEAVQDFPLPHETPEPQSVTAGPAADWCQRRCVPCPRTLATPPDRKH